MKNLSFLIVVTALAFGTVACGNQKEATRSNSNINSNSYSNTAFSLSANGAAPIIENRLGYINTVSPQILVGNIVYKVSPNSYSVIQQALQLAQQQGIQPVMVNNSSQYKANLTGYLTVAQSQQQQVGIQSGYQQQPQPQGSEQLLIINQAAVIR